MALYYYHSVFFSIAFRTRFLHFSPYAINLSGFFPLFTNLVSFPPRRNYATDLIQVAIPRLRFLSWEVRQEIIPVKKRILEIKKH